MLQALGILSGVISVICYFPYIHDILLNKTKPQRASWLIWLVLMSISFISQYAKGASDSLWLPGIQTIGVTIIFFITLKYGVGGLSKKDAIALIIAFSGLYIWYLTQEATWALIIVILVDAIGSLLTILKTYKDPGSETASFWFLSGLSGLIAAISVGSWNFILLVYPIYFCLQSWAVLISIYTSPNKFKNFRHF